MATSNSGFVSGQQAANILLPIYPFTIIIGMILAVITVAYFWRKENYSI